MADTPQPLAEESLLIASPEAWRDVCFSLPAVRALAAAGNRVRILCPEPQRTFWLCAGYGEPFTYPVGAPSRRIASLLGGLTRVLLWEGGHVADACAKAGIPERIGLPAPKLVKRLTNVLERKVVPGPQEHFVQRYLETAELLGASPFEPRHFAPLKMGVERDREAVLAIPGSDFGSHHEWAVERWKEVVDHIKELDHEVTIALSGAGRLGKQLAELTDCETVEIDFSDPAPLAAFGLCLAADGSLPHLAAAYGTTCAVLFGPEDPELVRPLGRQHLVVRRKVECSPCFVDKCPHDLRCQNDLSTERVLEKLARFSGEE